MKCHRRKEQQYLYVTHRANQDNTRRRRGDEAERVYMCLTMSARVHETLNALGHRRRGDEAERIGAFKGALGLSDEDAAPVHIDVGRRIMRSKFEAASRAGSSESTRALQKLIYVSDLVFGARKVPPAATGPPLVQGALRVHPGCVQESSAGWRCVAMSTCCLCCACNVAWRSLERRISVQCWCAKQPMHYCPIGAHFGCMHGGMQDRLPLPVQLLWEWRGSSVLRASQGTVWVKLLSCSSPPSAWLSLYRLRSCCPGAACST